MTSGFPGSSFYGMYLCSADGLDCLGSRGVCMMGKTDAEVHSTLVFLKPT